MISWEHRTWQGRVDFIKEVRRITELGLKPVKDAVESMENDRIPRDTLSDDSLLSEALAKLVPEKYAMPTQKAVIDYPEMWRVFKLAVPEELRARMEVMEKDFGRLAKVKVGEEFITGLLEKALYPTFVEVLGGEHGEPIRIYDQNGSFTSLEEVDMRTFKLTMHKAFNNWLDQLV